MRQARVRASGKEVLSEEGGGKCQNDLGGRQAEIAQRCSRGEQHAKEKNLEDARVRLASSAASLGCGEVAHRELTDDRDLEESRLRRSYCHSRFIERGGRDFLQNYFWLIVQIELCLQMMAREREIHRGPVRVPPPSTSRDNVR